MTNPVLIRVLLGGSPFFIILGSGCNPGRKVPVGPAGRRAARLQGSAALASVAARISGALAQGVVHRRVTAALVNALLFTLLFPGVL